MTTIENRVEALSTVPQSDYAEREFTAEEIEQGVHRAFIGGSWDTHGRTQLDYLLSRGLKRTDTVLDVGCGCFRAGRHLIDYLEPERYFGVDANLSLLQAGYDFELSDEQRAKLPPSHLRANERFNVDFGVPVDLAIAQSVFSHVSLNHIRLCLFRVAKVVRPGGVLLATFFEKGNATPIDQIFSPDKRPFFTEQDVFWYFRDDLRWAASFSPWQARYIGDWGHPAGQRMMEFTRLTDAEWAARKTPSTPTSTSSTTPKPLRPLREDLSDFVRRGRKWAARRLAG